MTTYKNIKYNHVSCDVKEYLGVNGLIGCESPVLIYYNRMYFAVTWSRCHNKLLFGHFKEYLVPGKTSFPGMHSYINNIMSFM